MSYDPSQPDQTIRIPFRIIERAYGKGEDDIAGDDIVYCFTRLGYSRSRYRFEFDTAHDNPWYHALVITIPGITRSDFAQMIDLLSHQGLSES